MTIDTTKQQAFAGPIVLRDMPTFGASLRGGIGIDFDDHAARKCGFIGQHPMQFGKAPFGVHRIRLALLTRDFFNTFAVFLPSSGAPAGPLSNAAKVFNANERTRVLLANRSTDLVVGLLLQPSFSPRDRLQATGGAASAFTLQAFAQSCVMIGAMSDTFAWVEGGFASIIRGHSQIAYTNIHPNDLLMVFWLWIGDLDGEGDDQIKLFARLVVPQFGSSYLSSLLNHLQVFVIATIANVQPTGERQNAHLLALPEAIIMTQVIGQGGRARVGRFVQSLEPFLRETHLTMLGVLPEFGPQAFIGRRDLTLDTARHLRRQVIARANLAVTALMHAQVATRLTVSKSVVAHEIERIAIRQLRLSQELKLLRGGIQFEFGRDGLFHTDSLSGQACKFNKRTVKEKRSASFLPGMNARGFQKRRLYERKYRGAA